MRDIYYQELEDVSVSNKLKVERQMVLHDKNEIFSGSQNLRNTLHVSNILPKKPVGDLMTLKNEAVS